MKCLTWGNTCHMMQDKGFSWWMGGDQYGRHWERLNGLGELGEILADLKGRTFKILDLHSCETGSQNAYFTLRRQKHTICTVPMGTFLAIEVPLFLPFWACLAWKGIIAKLLCQKSAPAVTRICPFCGSLTPCQDGSYAARIEVQKGIYFD